WHRRLIAPSRAVLDDNARPWRAALPRGSPELALDPAVRSRMLFGGIGLSDSEPRKGMPSPQLDRESFRARFLAQFRDPAFALLAGELERVADVAWDAYSNNRKSPRTRKGGPEFADADYELSEDWLA